MAEKEFEADDPMVLSGVALPGDTRETMAETFIEELLLMGYADELILKVFQTPYYAGAHRVLAEKGEDFVRDLIRRVRGGYGAAFRFASRDAGVPHA